MTGVSITIDPADLTESDYSSSDESSVVDVKPPSEGSHGYLDYDGWAELSYPDELNPADSASRPRTSNRNRSLHGSRSASRPRQQTRRQMPAERDFSSRPRRSSPRHHSHSPDLHDSGGDSDDYQPHYPPQRRHQDPRQYAQPGQGYPPSISSGPSYNQYGQTQPQPQGHAGYHPHQNGPSSDQLVRLNQTNPNGQYPPSGYPGYGPPNGHSMHPFYAEQAHRGLHQPHPQSRMDHHPLAAMGGPHGMPPYGAPPYHPDLMPYNPNGYYNYADPYAMYPGMPPFGANPYFPFAVPPQPEPKAASPAPAPAPTPTPAPPPPPPPPPAEEAPKEPTAAEIAKDEAIARLEKLIMDDRLERETKEANRLAAIAAEEAAAAELARQTAHDKAIADAAAKEAAAIARQDAEARAAEEAAKAKEEAIAAANAAAAAATENAEKAAEVATAKALEAVHAAAAKAKEEEAAKAKEEADKAQAEADKAKAEEEARIAAEEAKNRPPVIEKKKPIKFKDAVGRKFSFPFELCETWPRMQELIKQAFIHIDVIGPHVIEGHYDLVGPNGDIILPQVWETVVEPDWTITMHMWPIPEKPKEPDPPPAPEPAPPPPKPVEVKKIVPKRPPPAFTHWMVGRRLPPRPKKAAPKKEEPAA
ncbi:hypothetical protein N7493_004310 [Penicillium malachiteum]|uniref:Ubiquitin-like domain-containing protein n=1 Tax=Penicillium malachiteum TaxID=1324776 RepID=A0AAD6MYM6_9EURO|nr:hypothetical protein N7493_004310 [Penicillium malachiteum]